MSVGEKVIEAGSPLPFSSNTVTEMKYVKVSQRDPMQLQIHINQCIRCSTAHNCKSQYFRNLLYFTAIYKVLFYSCNLLALSEALDINLRCDNPFLQARLRSTSLKCSSIVPRNIFCTMTDGDVALQCSFPWPT